CRQVSCLLAQLEEVVQNPGRRGLKRSGSFKIFLCFLLLAFSQGEHREAPQSQKPRFLRLQHLLKVSARPFRIAGKLGGLRLQKLQHRLWFKEFFRTPRVKLGLFGVSKLHCDKAARERFLPAAATSFAHLATNPAWSPKDRPQKPVERSEERRVGKECMSRWSPGHDEARVAG